MVMQHVTCNMPYVAPLKALGLYRAVFQFQCTGPHLNAQDQVYVQFHLFGGQVYMQSQTSGTAYRYMLYYKKKRLRIIILN